MFRLARENDLPKIMEIVSLTIKDMGTYGSNQWDKKYPTANDFFNDINENSLYVYEYEGDVGGFVCINNEEADEYNGLEWSNDSRAVVIHRMAVNPLYRNRGIGTKIIQFSEEIAAKQNICYVKTDTYSLNTKMKNLFVKCGFTYVADVRFRDKENVFNCYEKVLPN